jgi:hypothetical protein
MVSGPAAEEGVVEPHERAGREVPVDAVERAGAGDAVDRALLEMVLEVAADAGAIEQHRDAGFAQPVGRADAGELEELRRTDGAGAEDHLAAGGDLVRDAAAAEADAGGLEPVEQHALGQRFGLDAEVGPAEDGPEEGGGGGDADAPALVDVEIAGAFVVSGVEVGDARHAHLGRGGSDGVEDLPGDPRRLDPPLAAGAVVVAVAEEMVLERPEQRQHVVPAPAGEAELAPVVVVGGLAAHRDHGIDGRGAAQHLAAWIGEIAPGKARLGLGAVHPVRARIADGEEVADRDAEPDPVVVAARFEQEDAGARIGAQPVGEHAPGRAAADDDIVVRALEGRRGPSCGQWAVLPGATLVWAGATGKCERRQRATSSGNGSALRKGKRPAG